MSEGIIVVIISTCGLVLAAIIAGVSSYLSNVKKKNSKDSPTITSGGHSIVSSGQSSQNIYISNSDEPQHSSKKSSNISKLLETTENIKDLTNQILIENQKVLTPIFQKKPNLKKVRNDMTGLLNIQTSRVVFGDWQGYLESEKNKTDNAELRELLSELLDLINRLSRLLYENQSSVVERGVFFQSKASFYATTKASVVNYLAFEETNLDEIGRFVEGYLEILRNLVSDIGRVIGKIKSSIGV